MSNAPAKNLDLYAIEGFAELRMEFIAGLNQRIDAIKNAPDIAGQAHGLHRLLGAARCYGEDRLAQIAEELTLVLEKENKLLDEDSIEQLNCGIRCLI